MGLGHFSERLLHSWGTPRLLFLPLVALLLAGTCLGLALGPPPLLYPLTAIAGLGMVSWAWQCNC